MACPVIRGCARETAVRKVIPLDVVETIREGLLVLEPDLTVRFANRSFCQIFAVTPKDTVGRKLYELGNGQWDIPRLRTALETIVSGRTTIEAFEVDQFFPSIGRRVMVLNARKVYRPGNKIQQILLGNRRCHRARDVGARARGRPPAYRHADARADPPGQEQPAVYCGNGHDRGAQPEEWRRARPRLKGSRIASTHSGSSIPS